MNRRLFATMFIMMGGILAILIMYAYSNPQTLVQTATGANPTPNLDPSGFIGGIKQFMSDMSSNMQMPKGLG